MLKAMKRIPALAMVVDWRRVELVCDAMAVGIVEKVGVGEITGDEVVGVTVKELRGAVFEIDGAEIAVVDRIPLEKDAKT